MRRLGQVNVIGAPLLAVLALAGCEPQVAPPPPLDPPAIASAALTALDRNRSGDLCAAELAQSQGLRSGAAKIDADSNGAVTGAELTARLAQYDQFPVQSLPLGCIVRLDGRPLVQGEVRLVPESFFGDSRRVASGRTDEHGVVDFKVEGSDQFGVPQGMYRIEVSKPDAAGKETLPARYNTHSQLGQEIAFDRREIEGALRLELSSR
jgi:hypothetical protein